MIKFRTWLKKEQKMIFWDKHRGWILDAIPYDAGDEWTENCIVMQYTGAKDKTGQEIYEGDVVKDVKTNEIGEIEFGHPYNQGFYCRIKKDFNGVEIDKSSWFVLTIENSKELEVIGNIYENPDLIARQSETEEKE